MYSVYPLVYFMIRFIPSEYYIPTVRKVKVLHILRADSRIIIS